MAAPGRIPAMIVAAFIVVLGIIHLGVGIGLVARYRQFSDIFQQTVGLSAYNIVIGLYAIAVGIFSLMVIIQELPALSKIVGICSGVLGVITIASLIAALVINSQSISYIRRHLTYHMNSYGEVTAGSDNLVDRIQTKHQCCGVNLWLDYSEVGLGAGSTGGGATTGTGGGGAVIGTGGGGAVIGTGGGSNTGTGGSSSVVTETGSGTRAIVNTGTRSIAINGRRRRHLSLPSSPLVKAVRRRRQAGTGSTFYNLPSSYTVNLPLSCCINSGTTSSNTIGGYCLYNSANSSDSFYVQGCLAPVADIAVAQITGIAVINVCLAIVAIVLVPILIQMFPAAFDPNNPINKQPLSAQRQQEQEQQQQQMQYGGYYVNTIDPNAYYSYPQPTYFAYQ